ncbi:hypothetical protein [Scopulibacillus cellulosilyticus]|uniref:Uncharacterized protein n=1 Tax=Scopulibacillus cellulosilyticus TaxID=2665665 RepID=A0ABW2PWT3_9BACL
MVRKKEKIEIDELRLYEPTNYYEIMLNDTQETETDITNSNLDDLNNEG